MPLTAASPDSLPATLDRRRLPRHVAIVMDGNRRWARTHGLRIIEGHQRGARATRAVIEACVDVGIAHLTIYTFSTENWHRPAAEVRALMKLIEDNLRRELPELHANRVQIRHRGRREHLPASLLGLLDEAVRMTRGNSGLVLHLALNYGGRTELVDAARALAGKATRGELRAEAIDERALERELYTPGVPDPDLLIRTGGEMRLSNFMLWQIAYAEMWVTPTLWPEFTKEEFWRALSDFQNRERRYGAARARPRIKGTPLNGNS